MTVAQECELWRAIVWANVRVGATLVVAQTRGMDIADDINTEL